MHVPKVGSLLRTISHMHFAYNSSYYMINSRREEKETRSYEKFGQAFKCNAADQHALQHVGSQRVGHR